MSIVVLRWILRTLNALLPLMESALNGDEGKVSPYLLADHFKRTKDQLSLPLDEPALGATHEKQATTTTGPHK